MLYERLRSLRFILIEKPKKFDEKVRHVTRIVACNTRLVLFSVSLNAMNDE